MVDEDIRTWKSPGNLILVYLVVDPELNRLAKTRSSSLQKGHLKHGGKK